MKKDAESARAWMVELGIKGYEAGEKYNRIFNDIHDKIAIICACAQLTDEQVIRIRCFPNVWGLHA